MNKSNERGEKFYSDPEIQRLWRKWEKCLNK